MNREECEEKSGGEKRRGEQKREKTEVKNRGEEKRKEKRKDIGTELLNSMKKIASNKSNRISQNNKRKSKKERTCPIAPRLLIQSKWQVMVTLNAIKTNDIMQTNN